MSESEEIALRLDRLIRIGDGLVSVLGALECEVPMYGLPSMALVLASLSECVRVDALEVWGAALRVSGEAQMAAGLPDPKLIAYVSSLLGLGGVAGRSEAQACPAVESEPAVTLELDGEAGTLLRDLLEAADRSGAAVRQVAGSESETALASATLAALTGAATLRDTASALYVALTEPGGVG